MQWTRESHNVTVKAAERGFVTAAPLQMSPKEAVRCGLPVAMLALMGLNICWNVRHRVIVQVPWTSYTPHTTRRIPTNCCFQVRARSPFRSRLRTATWPALS